MIRQTRRWFEPRRIDDYEIRLYFPSMSYARRIDDDVMRLYFSKHVILRWTCQAYVQQNLHNQHSIKLYDYIKGRLGQNLSHRLLKQILS